MVPVTVALSPWPEATTVVPLPRVSWLLLPFTCTLESSPNVMDESLVKRVSPKPETKIELPSATVVVLLLAIMVTVMASCSLLCPDDCGLDCGASL